VLRQRSLPREVRGFLQCAFVAPNAQNIGAARREFDGNGATQTPTRPRHHNGFFAQ
jgi:hypothetical protein